jgi:hypothetical protein
MKEAAGSLQRVAGVPSLPPYLCAVTVTDGFPSAGILVRIEAEMLPSATGKVAEGL